MSVTTAPVLIPCPSCRMEIPAHEPLCRNCGFQLTPVIPSARPPRVVAVASKIPIQVRLHFLVDTTGSTAAHCGQVVAFVQRCGQAVAAKASEVTVSLYSCGDLDYGEKTVMLAENLPLPEAQKRIEKLTYQGGGDLEETHLASLEQVMDWIPPAGKAERHCLIACLTDGSKPLRSDKTPQQLGAEYREHGILPVLVCQPCPLLQQFAEASGAFMFEISRDPSQQEVTVVAAKVAASIVASVSSNRKTIPL